MALPRSRLAAALAAVLCAALGAAPARAGSTIYLCVDAAGHKELTDTDKRGCKRLDMPGAAVTVSGGRGGRGGGARAASAPPPVTPAGFPRVDPSQQRQRDDDRRAILQDELNAEQARLGQMRSEFNNGAPPRRPDEGGDAGYRERVTALRESIGRSEKNIDALKRELANIK